MHSWLLVSKYTSPKRLLYSSLVEAVNAYTQDTKEESIKLKKIPLYKGRDNSKILYISGVAQHLSKSHNSMTMEIADGIACQLLALGGDVFNVKIVPPGWIYLELTQSYLATWLENLAIAQTENNGKIIISEPSRQNLASENLANLFTIQYAHARCCSWVLLAHREELLKLTTTSLHYPELWQLEFPQPIPWLTQDNQLRLNQPAETHLIAILVQIVDDLMCSDASKKMNWQKAAWELSQALENFLSQCRIWGEVKIASPELAQARLGLVMATGRLLRFLLLEKLVSSAPLEL